MRTYSYTELLDFYFSVKQTVEENELIADKERSPEYLEIVNDHRRNNVCMEIKEALNKLK